MKWLEPDINDHLQDLAAQGVTSVIVVPIGFVSDHMEVIYDLDTEAAAPPRSWGWRTTASTPPATTRRSSRWSATSSWSGPRSSVASGRSGPRSAAEPPNPYVCAVDCCINLRSPLPTVP